MKIDTSCVLADKDILGEDIHKNGLLLARAGILITHRIRQSFLAFGINNIKIQTGGRAA